jgi:hypothetical protein
MSYLHCLCLLRMVVSNIYCVVFLFCFYLQLFIRGRMSYLYCLCCVFVLFLFVLCTLCCQFLWIVLFDYPSVFSSVYLSTIGFPISSILCLS